jgi:nucleotide-binding universal stress UspA family protein
MSELYGAAPVLVNIERTKAVAKQPAEIGSGRSRRPSIVVALDGSKAAEAALPYAEGLAQCSGSVLHLVHALGKSLSEVPSAWEIDGRHEAMHRSQSYLAEMAGAIRARVLHVETLLREGQAAVAIVQAGDECGASCH